MTKRDKKTGRFVASEKTNVMTNVMTNSEAFEKAHKTFADALRVFNEQKEFKSFDDFLNAPFIGCKFKVGDLIVLQPTDEVKTNAWCHNVVFEVMKTSVYVYDICHYTLKFLTPHELGGYGVGDLRIFGAQFIDDNCIKY